MELKQVLPLQIRVDLGIMAVNGYSTLSRSPELESHHQMQFSILPRTHENIYEVNILNNKEKQI